MFFTFVLGLLYFLKSYKFCSQRSQNKIS